MTEVQELIDKATARIEALEHENKRLRAALKDIQRRDDDGVLAEIASEALSPHRPA